jgi:hypothetical protein
LQKVYRLINASIPAINKINSPALGNISPRRAAKSAKGCEKLVAWLKLLENHTAKW